MEKNTLLIRGKNREGDEQSPNYRSKKKQRKREKGAGPPKKESYNPSSSGPHNISPIPQKSSIRDALIPFATPCPEDDQLFSSPKHLE